jgi:hypothetical protein
MRKTHKLLLATIFTFACFHSFAQIGGKKSSESIVIFDSIRVNPGDTIHLGNGSDRAGDFIYIYQPPNAWIGTHETSLPRNYANKYFVIKHFKVQKDKRSGDKTLAIINPGMLNCVADIEAAIKAQEIVAINSRSFVKKEDPKVMIVNNNSVSVADELVKLKKLADDGILTKEEYDAQKKKLLEKN